MVLTLFDQCRLFIRDGIEAGAAWIWCITELPAQLRQSILEMVLMHGTINEPNCTAIFASVAFLKGLTSLNTQNGSVDDHQYLDRLIETLGAEQPTGGNLGSRITELQLNIYRTVRAAADVESKETSLLNVIRLVGQCPNLAILNIRLVDLTMGDEPFTESGTISVGIFSTYSAGSGLLNGSKLTEPCASVMENLTQLSVVGCRSTKLFDAKLPVLKFKRLTSLHLENCSFGVGALHEILVGVARTLTSMHLQHFDFAEDSNYGPYVLPFWLPELKTLKVKDDGFWIRLYKPFLQQLLKCPRLEQVELDMTVEKEMEDDYCLEPLNNFRGDLEISLSHNYYSGIRPIFAGRHFRFVDLFGEKITSFKLMTIDQYWDSRFNTGLEHMIKTCPNLTSLILLTPTEGKLRPHRREELKAGKLALSPLFADPIRALKLTQLVLTGGYEPSILELVFENCTKLNSFTIWDCPQLTDDHFCLWARRGARLENITVQNCPSISDDGLIPILISSGEKLRYCLLASPGSVPNRITCRTWMALFEHCRYIKKANIPSDLMDSSLKKCFVNKVEQVGDHEDFGDESWGGFGESDEDEEVEDEFVAESDSDDYEDEEEEDEEEEDEDNDDV